MKFLSLFIALMVLTPFAYAKKLAILHVNDLHSYFLPHRNGKGGYARLAALIKKLKEKASHENMASIVVDGGDWGEGTTFYYVKEGRRSIESLEQLGIEAAVIGNHDHMFGQDHLVNKVRQSGVKTKILSANMIITPEMQADDIIFPYKTFDKDGLKVTVMGLSTDEPHYEAYLRPGFIRKPIRVAKELESDLKEKSDIVIALTHLGVDVEQKLAKRTKFIDVVVGGHSHTRLDNAIMVKNKRNIEIPVVQAGAHALAVGELIVDIDENKNVKTLSYKLHDVTSEIETEKSVQNFVEQVVAEHDELFGHKWNELIGHSEIALNGYENGQESTMATCWGEHQAKMTKDAVDADLSIHIAKLNGMGFGSGPITYGMLVENFPHIRHFGDEGWSVAKFKINGELLRIIMKIIIPMQNKLGLSVSGLEYREGKRSKPGKPRARKLRVNGKKIKPFKLYTLALPSDMTHVFQMMKPGLADLLLKDYEESNQYYWPLLEDYVKKNTPLKCLANSTRDNMEKVLSAFDSMDQDGEISDL